MAVKLRLTRVGKKKQPQYRVVAADSRSARDGRFIQIIGTYNPRTEPSAISIDSDKAVKWLMEGAQPTDRVQQAARRSRVPGRRSPPPRPRGERFGHRRRPTAERRRRRRTRSRRPSPRRCSMHIVRSIVDDPEAVRVEGAEGRNRVRLEVKVGPGDLGRVIGRRGRTAQSIRTVVRAAAARVTASRSTSTSSTEHVLTEQRAD